MILCWGLVIAKHSLCSFLSFLHHLWFLRKLPLRISQIFCFYFCWPKFIIFVPCHFSKCSHSKVTTQLQINVLYFTQKFTGCLSASNYLFTIIWFFDIKYFNFLEKVTSTIACLLSVSTDSTFRTRLVVKSSFSYV